MKFKRVLLALSWLFFAVIGGSLTVLAGVHLYLSPSLPSVESLRDVRLQTPLRIYSSDGKLIGEIGEMRRTPVKFQEIPQGYIDALLSAEDAQFYSHHGVSIKGLMRASSQLLMSGDIQGGGSTITMQVARNFFLTKRQEFKRKFNEILLALRIERELSKEEILELYVNVIFLGNRAYGIQAASQVYYGKPLDQLSIAQLATLAGLPKAPSTINPLANPTRATERRNWILGRMLELNKIDEATYRAAIAEPVVAKYHGTPLDLNASYVAEMARRTAVEMFGPQAYTDGYRIYTTVDSELQSAARQAVIVGLQDYDKRHGFRGPEQKLQIPEEVTKAALEKQVLEEQWVQPIRTALQELPAYAEMQPAAIIALTEQDVHFLLRTGETVSLPWEGDMSEWRPYVSVNRVGPKPKQPADLLEVGDVVRLWRDQDNQWKLTQIPQAQAAMVVLNPRNGAILALVGGLDFQQSNFNRAIQARRQPGSSFKPFLYTTALENGYTAASLINDSPIVFDDANLESAWRPENSGGDFLGPTRLRKALYLSRNLVSIRLLQSIGIDKALAGLGRFGFDASAFPRDLSIALGSFGVTPLNVAQGYAVLANGGYKVDPYHIERILNFDGQPVYEARPATVCRGCTDDDEEYSVSTNDPFSFSGDPFEINKELRDLVGGLEPQDYPRAPKVVDDQVAYIMDSILKDVVQRGTATKAKVLKRSDIAGKTGTTNNATDAWFGGYGGDLAAVAWLGFDDTTTLGRQEYGGTAALPVWIEFMRQALRNRPEIHQPQPPGLVTVRINPDTGKRARADDPNAIYEIFRSDHVPEFDSGNGIESPWQEADKVRTESIF
ncbi:penicillin-binding protein 1A [Saccharophagus sp. K07]|uniref:penicillin-binding protein 1A n=1 Tax=Saccharophagus sp. K07 TaxID=2283636 RepID=UPI00165292BF|nr:penicillin-binding protein 1A [Saccharophagus sp. K07]MBC6905839.1 penicillin-binding protein 1A [Saccharophagus sp. K07]